MKEIIGFLLMASPFVGITIYIACTDGWRCAVFMWCFVALLLGLIIGGMVLIW